MVHTEKIGTRSSLHRTGLSGKAIPKQGNLQGISAFSAKTVRTDVIFDRNISGLDTSSRNMRAGTFGEANREFCKLEQGITMMAGSDASGLLWLTWMSGNHMTLSIGTKTATLRA